MKKLNLKTTRMPDRHAFCVTVFNNDVPVFDKPHSSVHAMVFARIDAETGALAMHQALVEVGQLYAPDGCDIGVILIEHQTGNMSLFKCVFSQHGMDYVLESDTFDEL